MSILKCPVCDSELNRIDKSFKCKNNHSYDIAKKNYVNLMLANQGHHLNEGDSKEMIDARRRFLESSKYDSLRNKLVNIIKELSFPLKTCMFTDIACGEGYYTNGIHNKLNSGNFFTIGLDISKAAINASSSKRNMMKLDNIEYVIGNMDYLPLLDESVDIMLNCFAPINEIEFSRVLKVNGYYIRVLPNVYHLYELKEFLYSKVNLNIPKDPNIFNFELDKEYEVNDTIELDNQQIKDLFTMTPYYYKTSKEAIERLYSLDYLKTRISFTIRVYKKK